MNYGNDTRLRMFTRVIPRYSCILEYRNVSNLRHGFPLTEYIVNDIIVL